MKATLLDGTVLEGQVYELHAFLNLSVQPKKDRARQDKPKQANHRKVKKKCKSRSNAHVRWGKFEDVKLIKLVNDGKDKWQIAKELGRTYQAVHSRLYVLRRKGLNLKEGDKNGKL